MENDLRFKNIYIQESSDMRNLAGKIFNIHSLVQRIRKLETANENYKNQMCSLNKSVNEVRLMHEKDKNRAENLARENRKFQEKLKATEAEILLLKDEYENVRMIKDQTIANYQYLLHEEKRMKTSLITNLFSKSTEVLESSTELSGQHVIQIKKKMQRAFENIDGSDTFKLRHMSKNPNQKTIKSEHPYEVWTNKTRMCDIGINCKLMDKISTVTRGTQFIASTTTRSTSTTGLLAKHNVGTIFPEVSFLSIDKILEHTTASLPEIIQPIEDPPFLMIKDKATQTETCAKVIKNKCLEKIDSGSNFGKNEEEILKYQCCNNHILTKNSFRTIDIDESKESYSALMAIQMKLTELCAILGKAFLKLVDNKNKILNKAYAAELNKHLLDLAVILQSNSADYQYITPLNTAEILKRDYLELPMGEYLAKAATKFQYCVDKTILLSSSDEIYADASKHNNLNLENSEKSCLDQLDSPQIVEKAKYEFSELPIDNNHCEYKLRKRKSDLVDVVPLVVDTLKRVRYESNIGATADCNLDDCVKKYTLTSNSLCVEQLEECQYENNNSNDEEFYGFSDSEYMLHVHNLESPASPIMFDIETPELSVNTPEIPLERISKSDYSPKSPKLVLNIKAEKTILTNIPLNRILRNKSDSDSSQFSSFICKFLNKYNFSGRQKTNAKKAKKNVECLTIYKLRRVLERYLLTESMQKDVYKCMHRLLAITNNKRYICYAIIEVIEDTEDKISVNYTPPAPSMTLTHQKILLLINKLNLSTNVFFSDFLKILDRHIFSFDSDKKCVSTLINLTLLFIGVADLCSLPLNSARLFIYKCLYFLNTKYIPMVFYVISAYPGVLPRAVDTSYFDDDALISSIQSALNCTVYAMENLEFKHRELFHILKYYYGYERVKPSREELVVNLLRRILASQFKDVKYAFALICKRNNVNWVDKYVVRKNILQCLNELTSNLGNSFENDEKIAFLLDTMSLILKCYPMDWDIRDFQDIFANLLYATDRNIIQEAAVCALIRLSRFSHVATFNRLYRWTPKNKFSKKMKTMIASLIYRKSVGFWQILKCQIESPKQNNV